MAKQSCTILYFYGCGNNQWGRECANLCSSLNPGCSGNMGCVPDPLGCSCMAGYKDLDCKETCETTGYYGSTCSEQCHCAAGVTCDPSIGCPDGPCEDAYSGKNCQVPNKCTDGWYGDLCKYQCHCEDDGPCDRNTGSCGDRKCKQPWIGSDCQLDGYRRTKVTLEDPSCNRGALLTLTCIVQANPLPSDEDIQVLDASDVILQNGAVTEFNYTKIVIFKGISIQEGDVFKCQVQSGIFGNAQTEEVVTIYDQPVMTVNPSVIASNATVAVSWNEWTKSEDNGDGPVIGYHVCYQQTGETWESCSNTVAGWSIVLDIDGDNNNGFQRGVEYEFGVAAVRPGNLGTGSISPLTQFTIPCRPPIMMPSDVQVSAVSDNEIQVQWQVVKLCYFVQVCFRPNSQKQ
ncbi:receptor-type tyrosine-protein phosphatase mu-like [Antedon mediterranea]|uniref:receptor-type tyrosine-protein phosphatase mu-like n=1 Tax=Antedon mediterranea TaxID=105859 RepID=UPI003AF87FC5